MLELLCVFSSVLVVNVLVICASLVDFGSCVMVVVVDLIVR